LTTNFRRHILDWHHKKTTSQKEKNMEQSGKISLLAALIAGMLAGCGGGGGDQASGNKPQFAASITTGEAAACAAWVSSQIYTLGNCVSYNGKVY
jgi:chitinase